MLAMLFTPDAVSSAAAKLISTDTFVMDSAVITGQGITTDGEYYYTSGSLTGIGFTAIAKYTVDGMDFVDVNVNPLPSECIKRGNNQ